MFKYFLKNRGVDNCNIEDVLHILYKEGIINTNIFYYYEVYTFMKEMYNTGSNNKEVVLTTMQHFKISRQTCYNIWNRIKKLEGVD